MIVGIFTFALCIAILAALVVVLFMLGYWAICLKHWIDDEVANRTSTKPSTSSDGDW